MIRHPATVAEPGLCYGGRSDLALAPGWERGCEALAGLLAGADLLICSPLERCRRPAERVAAELSCPLRVDPRWLELDFGAWEARPWRDIERAQSDAWAADYWHIAPPGGERYADLHARVRAALRQIEESDAPRVAVLTHAGPIRAALALCLGWPTRQYPSVRIACGSVNRLVRKGTGWRAQWLGCELPERSASLSDAHGPTC